MSSNYEPVKNWAKIPMGISFYGDCGGVAVDSKDNVYAVSYTHLTLPTNREV